jgi:tripartite-type tricarboxylate transporter receptor subunit TctC
MAMEPVNSSPAEFGKVIREEIVTWGKVVKAAGIKPQ